MARRALRWTLLLLTLVLVGCDHATKFAAQSALENRRKFVLIRGLLDFRYAENHDTAFSLLRRVEFPGKSIVLAVLATFALASVGFLWWRRRDRPVLEQTGFALLIAGAVGNVLDRAGRGYVIDFIHVRHWPVFNVADVAVVAGGILLGYAALRSRTPPAKATPTPT